jgi:hypothetical protein
VSQGEAEVTKKDETPDLNAVNAEIEAKADAIIAAGVKPGHPDYDWAKDYSVPADQLYVHTYPDGQVVALRRFKDIYSKQWLRSIRNLQTEFDIESEAVDRAASDTARQIIDARPAPLGGPDDFQDLWTAWSKADTELSAGE